MVSLRSLVAIFLLVEIIYADDVSSESSSSSDSKSSEEKNYHARIGMTQHELKASNTTIDRSSKTTGDAEREVEDTINDFFKMLHLFRPVLKDIIHTIDIEHSQNFSEIWKNIIDFLKLLNPMDLESTDDEFKYVITTITNFLAMFNINLAIPINFALECPSNLRKVILLLKNGFLKFVNDIKSSDNCSDNDVDFFNELLTELDKIFKFLLSNCTNLYETLQKGVVEDGPIESAYDLGMKILQTLFKKDSAKM